MAAISELSKTDLAERWQRARATIRNMKDEGEAVANRGIQQVVGLAGGAANGLLRGTWGDEQGKVLLPGTEVEADGVVYLGLATTSLLGVAGKHSDLIGTFAIGFGAPIVARYAEKWAKESL